jgi:hypothetical protein
MHFRGAVFLGFILCSFLAARDYKDYEHGVFVDTLRSGNHAKTKDVTYGFEWSMIGRCKSKETPPVLNKQKLNDVIIKPLSELENAAELIKLSVSGEDLRVFTTRVMEESSCTEHDTLISLQIDVIVRGKWLYFFGEDKKIAEFVYAIFPDKTSAFEERANLKYPIQDDFGFSIVFKVEYAQPKL